MTTGLRALGWRVTAINDVYINDAHRAQIWAASATARREFWMVYQARIVRRDPRR